VAIGQLWPPEQPSDTRVVLFVKLRAGLVSTPNWKSASAARSRAHDGPCAARIVQVPDIRRTKNGR